VDPAEIVTATQVCGTVFVSVTGRGQKEWKREGSGVMKSRGDTERDRQGEIMISFFVGK